MEIKDIFKNVAEYKNLKFLSKKKIRESKQTILETVNGIKITARHNIFDVKIIEEQYVKKQYFPEAVYEKDFTPKFVLDIGGYIGDLSLYCVEHYNSIVHCYEPTPQNFKILEQNKKINPRFKDNLFIYNQGVSSDDGYFFMNVQDIMGEIHASSHKDYDHMMKEIKVESVSLSTAIKRFENNIIDIVKIDTEGQEFPILLNSDISALANQVKYIVFEHHSFVDDYKNKMLKLKNHLEQSFVKVHSTKHVDFYRSKKFK